MFLDYETISRYNLTIYISDPDGLMKSQMVTIDINDVNEAPVIHNLPDMVTITEDVVGQVPTYTVDVTDQDGDVLLYTISTLPSSAPFEINSLGKVCLCVVM